MEITLASDKEIEAIIQIEATCFPKAEAASGKVLKERFRTFPYCFVVAKVEDKVIGFIEGCMYDKPCLSDCLYEDVSLHNPDGEYQMVFGLAVLPDYRKQKVGEALLNAFISLTKERNKKGIVLTCKDHLIAYYEKFGFIFQGVSLSTHGKSQWNDMLLLF